MKILFLTSAMNRGGAERVAATLCNAWAERGQAVTLVATYSGRGPCEYPLAESVEFVHLVDHVPAGGGRLLGYPARLRALRRLVRERAPDVVIAFLTSVNFAAILATRTLGVPVFACERTDPAASTDFPFWTRLLCRALYPLADRVIVQTDSTARSMHRLVPRARHVAVISNPIPDALLALPARPAPAGGRRRLVSMGRLSAEKRMDHLIEAFASLATQHPDVDLWIWGEGSLRGQLERQVHAAGLADRVFLPGSTDTPWQEMARGELFVLSSAFEGFPNVMLEAMALGLPCIAYDCPSGPRELSEDGQAAVLVPSGDRQRLREQIDRLLGDATQRATLGARAAASVRHRYALPTILAQWDAHVSAARQDHEAACA